MPGELTMNSLPCTMAVSIRRTFEVITAWVKSRVTRHSWVRSSMRAGTGQRPSRTYLPPCCSTTSTPLSLAAGAIGRSAVSSASSPSVRAESALSSRVSSSSALSRPSPPATRSASTTRSRSACDARRPGWSFDMAATVARQTALSSHRSAAPCGDYSTSEADQTTHRPNRGGGREMPKGELPRPAEFPHGPAGVPDLGHVADLAVLELHHVDIVGAGALAGWGHRAAVAAVGAREHGVGGDVFALMVGGEGLDRVARVREDNQHSLHPVGVLLKRLHVGERLR